MGIKMREEDKERAPGAFVSGVFACKGSLAAWKVEVTCITILK